MSDKEVKDGKSTWWIHIDFTLIFVIALLVGVGWYVKSEYDKNVVQERIKLDIARKEREQKEEESRAEALIRQKESAEENERKRKESLEYSRAQQAERLRLRTESQAKDEERRHTSRSSFRRRSGF